MNKLILILVLCAGVVFGGKLYLENKYKKNLDQAISLARSYADISYSDLTIGFDGSISIHDISFRNLDGPGSFTIKQTKAISSNKLAPLYGNIFKDGKTPEWLKISVNQLTIDSALIEPNTEDECTSFDTAFIYSAVDIKQIFSNLSIEFDFNDLNNSVADFRYEDQTSTLDLKFNFSVTKAQQLIINPNVLPVDNIQLSSNLDPDFASQLNDYCAKKLDMTTEKYVSDVLSSEKYFHKSFGYNFGNKASQALGTYMKGGHELSVYSNPSEQLKSLTSFNNLSAQEIMRFLNLSIKLDGQSVLLKSNAKSNFNEEKDKEDEPLVIRSKKRKYQPDSVSNLPNLIHSKVKIWRKDNKAKIEGRVDKYANGVAFIEIRKFGGKATYEINVKDIKKIEVLR